MQYSDHAPFGLLEYAEEPSLGEQMYHALEAGLTDPATGEVAFELEPGTHEDAVLLSRSTALAIARKALERAGAQSDGRTAVEMLPTLEKDYRVSPGPLDAVRHRQAAIAARQLAPAGAGKYAVAAALRAVLGDDFLAYVPVKSASHLFPADPSSSTQVNAQLPGLTRKVVRTLMPVGLIGSPIWVPYANMNPADAEVSLAAGDVVMVQPDNTALSERVVVADARVVSGERQFRATFTAAHDDGSVVTNQPWPWQFSMARHALVVLTATAAADPVKRSRVDDVMARMMRGVTTWGIVRAESQTATTVTVGPFTVASPVGCVPVGGPTTYPRSF
jgi:hypothetical protein